MTYTHKRHTIYAKIHSLRIWLQPTQYESPSAFHRPVAYPSPKSAFVPLCMTTRWTTSDQNHQVRRARSHQKTKAMWTWEPNMKLNYKSISYSLWHWVRAVQSHITTERVTTHLQILVWVELSLPIWSHWEKKIRLFKYFLCEVEEKTVTKKHHTHTRKASQKCQHVFCP